MSGPGNRYAFGAKAWGICCRCGLRDLLNKLVLTDGYFPWMRMHQECRDDKHKQERLVKVTDPIALWRPSPEDELNVAPILSGVQNGGANDLSWSAASMQVGRIESYQLYISTDNDSFSLLVGQDVSYAWDGSIEDEPLDYSHTPVVPGTIYYYYVVALDVYNRGLRSNTISIAVALVLPSAPVLSGENNDDTNTLSWTAPTAGNYPIAGYRLYNADDDSLIVDTALLTYDDAGLDPGEYNYYMVAYDTQDNVSAHSNEIGLEVLASGAAVLHVPSSKDLYLSLPSSSPINFTLDNANVTDGGSYPDSIAIITVGVLTTTTSGVDDPTLFTVDGVQVTNFVRVEGNSIFGLKTHLLVGVVEVPVGGFDVGAVQVVWPSLPTSSTVVRACADAMYNVSAFHDFGGGETSIFGFPPNYQAGGAFWVSNIQYTGGDFDPAVDSQATPGLWTMIDPDQSLTTGTYFMTGYALLPTGGESNDIVPLGSETMIPQIHFIMDGTA